MKKKWGSRCIDHANAAGVFSIVTRTGTWRYLPSLVQWLQHSQKNYCELCNYTFVFHKQYTNSMPDGILPIWLYSRYVGWRLAQVATYLVRTVVVGCSWLLLVPYFNAHVWRWCFTFGDRVSDFLMGVKTEHDPPVQSVPWPAWPSLWNGAEVRVASRALGRRLVREFTEGWVHSMLVTGGLLLTFIAVFLLREWVAQHFHEIQEEPEEVAEPEDPARAQRRAAALAAAHVRAEHMMAADPDQVAMQDIVRAALGQQGLPPPREAPRQPLVAPPEPELDDDAWVDQELAPRPARDDEWVDESDDDVVVERPPLPNHVPLRPAPDVPLDDRDEDEEWDDREEAEHFAEDMEGMLEAVGLHGPFIVFFQSLVLVQGLAIATTVVFVALPYILGRMIGLRAFDLVLLPLHSLSRATDPVLEWLVARLASVGRLVLPSSLSMPRIAAAASSEPGSWAFLAPAVHVAHKYAHTLSVWGMQAQGYVRSPQPWARVVCVGLGHLYLLLILVIEAYAGAFLHNVRMEWTADFLKQYLLIAKVLFFSVVDLLCFPLMCGVLLDWCFFPLFPGASLGQMVAGWKAAPFTYMFCRWTFGTVYMFHFAQFLSAIRSVVRPGVMCWMRDATDPDFHPIREILETRSGLQLRRIGDSVLIYGVVACLVFGAGLRAVYFALPGVLPLVWKPSQPRLQVPLDLLVVHFGLHIAVKRTRLTFHARRAFRQWWIWAAKRVRLSAFLMGDHQLDEQGYVPGPWTSQLRTWLRATPGLESHPEFVHTGGYARVPADDHPPRKTALVIATTAEGVPVDDEAVEALNKQEAALATMTEKAAYTIVYIPPHLRRRVVALLGLLWVSCSLVVVGALIGPLLLGRGMLRVVGGQGVHDVYAIGLGYVAVTLGVFAKHGYSAWQTSHGALGPRLAQSARLAGRVVYVLGAFSGVVPLLFGMVLYQYLIPVQMWTSEGIPTLPIVHTWALGLISLHCALLTVLLVRPDDFPQLWDAYDVLQHGRLWRIPAGVATQTTLLPVLQVLVPALLLPYFVAALALAARGELGAPAEVHQHYLRLANVAVLVMALGGALRRWVLSRLDTWTGVLRDELFLDSTELCNYDPYDAKRAEGHYGPRPERVVRGH